MEKNTISRYGWIIICALIAAVIIAFSTPFGKYVVDGASSIASGFINTTKEALSDEHKEQIIDRWEDKWKEEDPATCVHANTEIKNKKDATCTEIGNTGDTYCKDCKTKLSDGTELEMLEHITEAVEEIPATCTEKGLEAGTRCITCQQFISGGAEISSLGHDIEILEKKDATCLLPGLTQGEQCKRCSYKVLQTNIPATGHTEKIIPTVYPTCTQPGASGEVRCEVCNAFIASATTIPATGHTWNNGEITVVATCASTGVKSFKCTVCNETKTEAINKTAHRVIELSYIAPTCSQTGSRGGTKCEICEQIVSQPEILEKKPHDIQEIPGKEATCTTTGLTATGSCKVCGYVETEAQVIPAKGHTEVTLNKVEATCEQNGIESRVVCATCANVLSGGQTIQATGHTEKTVKGYAATCEASGLEDGLVCQKCNKELYSAKTIPALGHTYIYSDEVLPTCENDGKKPSSICKTCNKVFQEGDIIPALGHNEDLYIGGYEGDCYRTGHTDITYCTRCNIIMDAGYETPMVHNMEYVTTPETCKNPGIIHGICISCGAEEIVETIPLGHTSTILKESIVETCTSIGQYTYGCDRCTELDEIITKASLGHLDDVNDNICDRETCLAALEKDYTLRFKTDGTAYFYNMHGNVTNTYSGWKTASYASRVETPWYNNRDKIQHVIIDTTASYTKYWFDGYINIKSVTIRDSLTTIGARMFYGNTSLSSVVIGSKVTRIDSYAFAECHQISSVEFNAISASVDATAFTGSGSGGRFKFGSSVREVPSYILCGNSGAAFNATTIEFGTSASCITINNYAFAQNTNIKTITLPERIETISTNAFNGCYNISNIYWNAIQVTSANFSNVGASGLTVKFGTNVTLIPNDCFKNNTNLRTVTFNSSSCNIKAGAFDGCKSLRNISLVGVKIIGDYAFRNTGITNLTIPGSVSSIGNCAFYNCTSITSITIGMTSLNQKYTSTTAPFINAGISNGMTVSFNANVSSLPDYLFAQSNVCNVNLRNGLTTICNGVFYGCELLTSIDLPLSVKNIYPQAFATSGLKNITMDNSNIANYMWYANTSPSVGGIRITATSNSMFASKLVNDYANKYIVRN